MNFSKSPDRARMAAPTPVLKSYETRSLNRQPSRDTIISRISQSQIDVSIQVDVPEAENSKMRRKRGDRYTKKGTPIYSKEDIREQYCINEKELEVLEKAKRRSIFGCISKQREHQRKRSSLLPCVRGDSEESLPHTYVIPLKPPASPTKKAFTLPSHANQNDYEEVRRRPRSVCIPEPRRLEELESRLQQSSSRADSVEQPSNSSNGLQSPCLSTKTGSTATTPFSYGGRIAYTNPNTPDLSTLTLRRQLQSPDSLDERRAKHVSFDASSPQHGSPVASLQEHLSQSSLAGERLLDARKSPPEEVLRKLAESAALSPLIAKALLLEKLKKASMKTQATQTEASGSRRPTPSSPSSSRKIRMESRGSQTTLELLKTRKLIKSLSAVNSGPPPNDVYYMEVYNFDFNGERTRSEEFMLDSASENEKRSNKLTKAYSEGAILVRKGQSESPERVAFTDDEAENDSDVEFFVSSEISPPIEFVEPPPPPVREEEESNAKLELLKLPPQKSFDSTSGDDFGSQATVLQNSNVNQPPEAERQVLVNEMEVTRHWNSETDAHCLSHHASGESDSFTVMSTPTSSRSFKVGGTTYVVSPNRPRIDTTRSKRSVVVTSKHYWNVSVESESSYCPITEKDTESDRASTPSSVDDKEKHGNSESYLTAIGNFESAASCATDSFVTALPDKESGSSRYSTLKTQASNETISSPSGSRMDPVTSPCPDPLPPVKEAQVSSEDEEVRSSSSGSYSLDGLPQDAKSRREGSQRQGSGSPQTIKSSPNGSSLDRSLRSSTSQEAQTGPSPRGTMTRDVKRHSPQEGKSSPGGRGTPQSKGASPQSETQPKGSRTQETEKRASPQKKGSEPLKRCSPLGTQMLLKKSMSTQAVIRTSDIGVEEPSKQKTSPQLVRKTSPLGVPAMSPSPQKNSSELLVRSSSVQEAQELQKKSPSPQGQTLIRGISLPDGYRRRSPQEKSPENRTSPSGLSSSSDITAPKLVTSAKKREGRGRRDGEKRYTRYFESENPPQDCVIEVHERSPAAQLKIKSVDAETECENTFDRKKIKDSLSLQLPPGGSLFSSPSCERKESVFKRNERARNDIDTSSDEDYSNKKKERRRTPDSESKREILKISMGRKSKSRSKSPDTKLKRKSEDRFSRSPSKELKTPSVERKEFNVVVTPSEPSLFIPPTPETPGMVRSPAMHEGFRIEDWTIDRTSETPVSPSSLGKKKKKKKACRSDTKPLVGALTADDSDERSSDDRTITKPELKTETCSDRLDDSQSIQLEIDYNLLTLDAQSGAGASFDSLRSVSPGSDSVFLSECVELATPLSGGTKTPDSTVSMVQPPEGFEDSPCTEEAKVPSSIQADTTPGIELRRDSSRKKRARSCTQLTSKEDLCHAGSSKSLDRRDMKRGDEPPQRSHSEERILANKEVFFWDFESKGGIRPLMLAPSDDEDSGVYDASYCSGTWMYIGENEELLVWGKTPPPAVKDEEDGESGTDIDTERCLSGASTSSEKDFRRKYTAVTHRLVHRKASMEMFRRMGEGTFDCDKSIVIRRDEGGEFGFRIHGSRPVVVSAIEPGTPAEASGLEVGDVIIALNGSNILDASHTEVVKLAHAGANELTLDIVRTSTVLEHSRDSSLSSGDLVCSGYLWKQSSHPGSESQWLRRWLCLKSDNCVYFFRKEDALHPVGAIMMEGYRVSRTSTPEKAYAIILSKSGVPRHILAADDEVTANRWAALLFQAAASATQHDVWMTVVRKCLQSFPDQISNPDCHGILCKLGHRVRSWTKYYCVLKDACLYFFNYKEPTSAIGVVFLHGYRVQSSSGGGRRVGFELLPPEPRFRHFHLSAETDHDRKRWLAALEYSIDRWIRIG